MIWSSSLRAHHVPYIRTLAVIQRRPSPINLMVGLPPIQWSAAKCLASVSRSCWLDTSRSIMRQFFCLSNDRAHGPTLFRGHCPITRRLIAASSFFVSDRQRDCLHPTQMIEFLFYFTPAQVFYLFEEKAASKNRKVCLR